MHTWQGVSYKLRAATPGDVPALRQLIARSIRELGADDYTPEQIEAEIGAARAEVRKARHDRRRSH